MPKNLKGNSGASVLEHETKVGRRVAFPWRHPRGGRHHNIEREKSRPFHPLWEADFFTMSSMSVTIRSTMICVLALFASLNNSVSASFTRSRSSTGWARFSCELEI
jgi:hypothetical protein